jgi:hypothetical protein
LQFTAVLWCLGAGALLLGLTFYCFCRAHPPLLLQQLSLHGGAARCGTSSTLGSLPTLLHAFGLTCLLAATWGGGRGALVASGVCWFGLDALGEGSCATDFPSPRARITLTRWLFKKPDLMPTCTFDWVDVIAAAVGAALPVVLHITLVALRKRRLSIEF